MHFICAISTILFYNNNNNNNSKLTKPATITFFFWVGCWQYSPVAQSWGRVKGKS
jgi:hypothetical protein